MNSITGTTYTFIGEENIGSGTYGVVRPVLRDDGQEYVVKLFEKNDIDLEIGVLREISVMRLLKDNNSNLIEMEDICMNDEEQFGIIMKRYKCDLYDAIVKGKLSLEKRICIARKLIEAVAFLHYNGIIHRDIKPANILLDENDNPVLCDFSLSKIFDGLSNDGTHTGNVVTERYRAPEVHYKKKYGYPVDIWSLGLVLYELFNMKLLCYEELDDIYSQLDGIRNISSNNLFYRIITGMIEVDQHKRLTSKQLIESEIFDVKPEIRRVCNYIENYKITDEIEEMCQYMEIKKRVTCIASQIYVDRTNCSVGSAVGLASKMYETVCHEIDDEYYPDEELLILEKMEFRLFI